MPDLSLEGEELDIFCSHCGHSVTKTVGHLRLNPDLDCTMCGARIHVNTSEFDDGVKLVTKRLNDLFRRSR